MLGGVETRSLDELPGWARELLEHSPVARLGLLDADDRPRVLPVTYALRDGAFWSAIDQKPKRTGEPARVRYLRRRPEAALTVDRYSDDWSDLAWVQVLGRVELLAVADAPQAVAALAAKYDPYARKAPPGPLLRLAPARFLCWRAADPPL
jgi:PPOX class probable F420-dependent enzyme